MIKKILKLTVAVMTLGLFTTSVFAADWGVSGQVRVNWDIIDTESVTSIKRTADGSYVSVTKHTIKPGVAVDEGNSWIGFDLTGENSSAGLVYYPADYRQEIWASTSGESGEWTSSASLTATVSEGHVPTEVDEAATNVETKATSGGLSEGTVKVAHSSGFYAKLGNSKHLKNYHRGQGYLLLASGGIDALDNRSSAADIGFKVSDSLSIGVVLERDYRLASGRASAFGSIEYPGLGADTREEHPVSNIGFKADFSTGGLSLGLVSISGSQAGDDVSGNPKTAAEANVLGLGLGASFKVGSITPYFNLWSPTTKAEQRTETVTFTGGKNVSTTYEEESSSTSITQIGVDYALNETSGVGFAVVNKVDKTNSSTRTDNVSSPVVTNSETETKFSSTELGYSTTLGTAVVKFGYVASKTGDNIKNTQLRVRFQQSF